MNPPSLVNMAPGSTSQEFGLGRERDTEMHTIPRRPVRNGGAQDSPETRLLVSTDNGREPSPNSTLYHSHDEEPYSHYYDKSDNRRKPRKQLRGIRSLSKRWTPGQYDDPIDHVDDRDGNHSHMRRYSYRKARSQILVPGFTKLLITYFLTAGLAGTFYGYSKMETLDTDQRHAFNFLMTGLIIALTINLTSSMKSYVQVLRWRLLAATSLSLEELDLAVDCAGQTKTSKLLFFYSLKERKVTRVQVLCVAWIPLNLISAVVTGSLGLTQEFIPVSALVPQRGIVFVPDLTSMSSIDSRSQPGTQEFAVNAYGIQGGQDYFIQPADDALTASYPGYNADLVCPSYSKSITNCIYTNATDDFAAYRLNIINFQEYQDTGAILTNKSDFSVSSSTTNPQFNYIDNEGNSQQLFVRDWAYGCVTYITNLVSQCGPRCTRVLALQAKHTAENTTDNPVLNITSSTIFDCNNTVSEVYKLTSRKAADIAFSNTQAQLVTGAIGFTGFTSLLPGNTTEVDTREYHLYSPDSYWSPSYQLRTRDVTGDEFVNNPNNFKLQPGIEALIQQFSMYPIAAFDGNGGLIDATSPLIPISSVQLKIGWKYTIPILVGIAAVQSMFLIMLALRANNVVIRSNSILSTARLFMPLLEYLRKDQHYTGSVLTGEEIARNHPETDARFFYGYRAFGRRGREYIAEFVEETKNIKPRAVRNFPDGDYH